MVPVSLVSCLSVAALAGEGERGKGEEEEEESEVERREETECVGTGGKKRKWERRN